MSEPGPYEAANQYERPNQPWVCGFASAGHACAAGPTARGRCPALAECSPKRDGDRWQCNRSTLRGGPCDEGPTPEGRCGHVQKCRPIRSLRAKRRLFIAACALAAIGGAAILLCSGWREHALRPGDLAQQHAQILEGAAGKSASCGACHAAATQSVAGWTVSLVATDNGLPTQPQLCMNCHAKSIRKDLSLAAHNLPAKYLEQFKSGRQKAGSLAGTVDSPAVSAGSVRQVSVEPSGVPVAPTRDGSAIYVDAATSIACAACHREHHGPKADLTAIANDACQACHQQRYESFAADHPDFGVWPYVRRSRIAFNHAAHRGKHFVEKKQTFDCRMCHVADASGQVARTASYEAACASCHDEKIAASIGRGVAMFTLPIMDVEAIKKAGLEIGPWPKSATGDFDGRLAVAMKLLLENDKAATDAMNVLGPGFEFQDVDPNNTIQVSACATLAKSIRSMFSDISQRGPVAARDRLMPPLNHSVREPDVAALLAGLSADTFRGAAGWLPQLDVGKAAWPAVEKPRILKKKYFGARGTDDMERYQPEIKQVSEESSPNYAPTGTWSCDEATLSIRYRPVAHADPVLTAWLELLAGTPHLEQWPIATAMFKELTKSTAAGLCATCHSVEQTGSGAFVVNWRAMPNVKSQRGFTKFTHDPHLVLQQLSECTSCHTVDDAAIAVTAYADNDPRHFVGDFKPITKRQCAECHTHTAAGDSCQSCHNYHVETVESWRLSVPQSDAKPLARRVGTAHR